MIENNNIIYHHCFIVDSILMFIIYDKTINSCILLKNRKIVKTHFFGDDNTKEYVQNSNGYTKNIYDFIIDNNIKPTTYTYTWYNNFNDFILFETVVNYYKRLKKISKIL